MANFPAPSKDDKLPETFEEAIYYVAQRMDKNTTQSPFFHFSGGMAVRNHLGLWHKESKLYQHMLKRFGLCHADDTGTLITNAANARLNNIKYHPEVDVEAFKAHWKALELDPATMEKIDESGKTN